MVCCPLYLSVALWPESARWLDMSIQRMLLLTDGATHRKWLSDLCQIDHSFSLLVQSRALYPALEAMSFDLIIVEIMAASRYDGLKFCQHLRKSTNVPILVLSSVRDEDFILSMYAAQIDDYIVKPIGARVLHAKLRAWQRWTKRPRRFIH